jgi:radical SAM superfamily enzyme YgiQ (UPF0313 family)
VADRVIAGEYENALVAWADEVDGRTPADAGGPVRVELGRTRFHLPARHLLPALDRYAHLALDGEHRLVGYTEASHGCVHRCRHCPIPSVYDGRTRIVDVDLVVADVAQLVELGAEHVTFGDPDFLNGPHHSLRVVRAVHAAFPQLTFDCTVKVEHILRHEDVWAEMAAAGCIFAVSAFETTSDAILERLDKGHTRRDMARAVGVLRAHGIEPRPSFLPFTPWTSLDDIADMVQFLAEHDLSGNVDPIQLTIRLLVPEGSLLLGHDAMSPYLEGYDADALTWIWHSADPAVDELQARLAAIVEAGVAADLGPAPLLAAVAAEVAATTGRRVALDAGATAGRPRLTEPWFC